MGTSPVLGILRSIWARPLRGVISRDLAAAVLSLRLIGWVAIDGFYAWRRPGGEDVNLRALAPRSIALLLFADLQGIVWNRLHHERPELRQLQAQPWLEPIRRLLGEKPTASWTSGHKALLRSICSLGLWPMLRLHVSGYDCSPLCICGAPQTTGHQIWSCPCTQAYLDQWGLPDRIFELRRLYPNWSVWETGLMRYPHDLVPLPTPTLTMIWEKMGVLGELFEHPGFGDGSGIHDILPSTRRCGWSVVSAHQVGDRTIVTACVRGPLPGPNQVVPLAELMALLIYLRHAVPGVDGMYVFHTDCAYVAEGPSRGRHTCCNGWALYADIWQQVFDKFDDLGFSCVRIVKVRAHRSLASATDDVDRHHIAGNAAADLAAKRGAAMHLFDEKQFAIIKERHDDYVAIARFSASSLLASLNSGVFARGKFKRIRPPVGLSIAAAPSTHSATDRSSPADFCASRGGGMEDAAPGDASAQSASPGNLALSSLPIEVPADAIAFPLVPCVLLPLVHRFVDVPHSSRQRCIQCLVHCTVRTGGLSGVGQGARCLHDVHVDHSIWCLPDGVFCTRCGVYSFDRVDKLHEPCDPTKASSGDRKRVRDRMMLGKHPRTCVWMAPPVRFPRTMSAVVPVEEGLTAARSGVASTAVQVTVQVPAPPS